MIRRTIKALAASALLGALVVAAPVIAQGNSPPGNSPPGNSPPGDSPPGNSGVVSAPEFDVTAAGVIAVLIGAGAILVARRRRA